MKLPGMLERIRAKVKSAKSAEERAKDRVKAAKTKAALETAQAQLKTAKMSRQIVETNARVELEVAKAKLNEAKARQTAASSAKWSERGKRISTIFGGVASVGRQLPGGGGSSRTAKVVKRTPARAAHMGPADDSIDDLFDNPYASRRTRR